MSGSLEKIESVAESVDLVAKELRVFFSEAALRLGSELNLFCGDRLALHVKYVPLQGGFVLNDMVSGAWSEQEIFVPCLRPSSGAGVPLILRLRDGEPELLLGTDMPLNLASRFDLRGGLHAKIAPPLRLGVGASRHNLSEIQVSQVLSADAPGFEHGVDAFIVSPSAFFLEGWIDDRRRELVAISMLDYATGARVMLPAYRVRRPDVDNHLQPARPSEFGFWTVAFGGVALLDGAALSLVFSDGSALPIQPPTPHWRTDGELMQFALATFGRRSVLGNMTARSFEDLDAGYGGVLAKLYRQMAAERRVLRRAHFGRATAAPSISMVCVLFGFPDFLYLLVSQFARCGTLERFEFIFVNNSPELEEVLLRDAELANVVFGVDIQIVTLNQNSGFSHANNVGVGTARGETIAIINPDVFPRHAAAVDRLRELGASDLGTDIYGGKLYYADGSVMHEGMFFNEDKRLGVLCGRPVWTVEHFRKGFADTVSLEVRPVPAITGALQVLSRRLFERMGGFGTEFFFGHYEDADLCLRIRKAGGRVLLDPGLAYWHYEGMGSIKKPEHIGSNLYNRWHFSGLWGDKLWEANNV